MTLNSTMLKSSLVGALGGLLFGFDTAVIAGTTGAISSLYQLTSFWLGFTVSIALFGTVIAAMTSGIPGERYGSRATLRVLAVLYVISALGCALAWNWPALLVFRFIGGLGIGGSSVLGPVYIAELAPAQWRGRLVGLFQINVVLGILLAYFSNFAIATLHLGATEWRWDLGVAAFPAILFFIFLFGIPQSPRWLAARGRTDEALHVLERTGSINPRAELQEIVDSIHLERKSQFEPLFQKKYSLPIFLAIFTGAFNQLSGINAILYYLNSIFAQAGFSSMSANVQAVIIGATNLFFTLIAMTVIDRLGRRTLLLVGSVGCAASLFGVAAIFWSHQHASMLLWCLVGFIGFFSFSQGAVIWVYLSEIFPTRVRAKGQSLGCSSHWIMNAIVSLLFPLFAKSSGAFPFAFFGLMMVVQLVVVYWVYPETKGVTLEQMQARLKIA
ncbi:MAG: sugar porter family MFS transporter [Bryobacteraceae bacterium]